MSRSITIRDVPDDIVDELAARAARGGRSMQEYLKLELAAVAARPDIEAWLDRARTIRQSIPDPLSIEEILATRDADRR